MNKQNSIEHIHHHLDLNEKINDHILGWKIQRVGWVIMLLIILAGTTGIYGSGPFSYRKQIISGNILQYEFFLRYQSETQIKFKLTNQTGITSIGIPIDYMNSFEVKHITPQPIESRIANKQLLYFFAATGDADIEFILKPESYLNVSGNIMVNGTAFPVKHFIYP